MFELHQLLLLLLLLLQELSVLVVIVALERAGVAVALVTVGELTLVGLLVCMRQHVAVAVGGVAVMPHASKELSDCTDVAAMK